MVDVDSWEIRRFSEETSEGEDNDSAGRQVVEDILHEPVFAGFQLASRTIPQIRRGPTRSALGDIAITRSAGKTTFDFGEWKSEMATRRNPDGTTSFVTIAPGIVGLEFVVGSGATPTLIVRDAQHEYVFKPEAPNSAAR